MENNNDKRVMNVIANGETIHSVIGTVSQVKQAIEDYKTQTSWDVSYSTNKTGVNAVQIANVCNGVNGRNFVLDCNQISLNFDADEID